MFFHWHARKHADGLLIARCLIMVASMHLDNHEIFTDRADLALIVTQKYIGNGVYIPAVSLGCLAGHLASLSHDACAVAAR